MTKSVMGGVFVFMMVAFACIGFSAATRPHDALAKPPGGGGKCGECPCQEEIVLSDGTVCWLESCHLLDRKDCLWDCHYVCPFPGGQAQFSLQR